MNITDELRDCIRTANRGYEDVRNPYNDREILHIPEEELLKIADRIDAEHESACAEAYGNGVMSVPIALDESAWVKLPVDADGVPIRVGDVVYDCNESPSEKFSVAIMELNKWGWSLLDSYGERNEPRQCHHYKAPTVEDVLREFAEGLGVPVVDSYIAACAAKLRLAGDE